MKGLILKDLLALKKQGKVMLAIFGFYAIYSYFTKNTSVLGTMLAVLSITLPISTMASDEYNKWDKLALSMPIKRKNVVVSKYVLGIMINIAATILMVVIELILIPYAESPGIREALQILLGTSMATLLVFAIIMPLLFKYGVEKGRLLLMVVIAIPVMGALLLMKSNIPLPDERLLMNLAYVSPLIIACLLLISINVSIGIYNKKEL